MSIQSDDTGRERERRFPVYEEAPGFRPGPRDDTGRVQGKWLMRVGLVSFSCHRLSLAALSYRGVVETNHSTRRCVLTNRVRPSA
jgi:hypothetical protein